MNIQTLHTSQLLVLFTDLQEELERRNIVRSANIAGDYTEFLVAKALSLTLMPSSTKGYDAIDTECIRYQIKGRKLSDRNPSREMGSIRGLEYHHFDWLAGVLYNKDFSVFKACLLPHATVSQFTVSKDNGNRHILHLRDAIWKGDGVLDITLHLLK